MGDARLEEMAWSGDVIRVDFGDGVFTRKEPHHLRQTNKTFHCNRFAMAIANKKSNASQSKLFDK